MHRLLLPLFLTSLVFAQQPGGGPAGGHPGGDGPWNHRILLARSADGLAWTLDKAALAESASVPELFENCDGQAVILYVDGKSNRLAALVEQGGDSWRTAETNLKGVDPCVVLAPDGDLRAYVKAGLEGAVDLWSSPDGLLWERIGECFRDKRHPNATDPDVFRVGNEWVMLLSLGPKLLRCTSTDGLKFQAGETLDLGGSVSDTTEIPGGWRTFFHQNPGPGTRMQIRSAFTADGRAWKVEEGVRLQAPAEGPARAGVGDPAPLRRKDGTWLMVVKSFITLPAGAGAGGGAQPRGPDPRELENRVKALEARIAELEARLKALEEGK